METTHTQHLSKRYMSVLLNIFLEFLGNMYLFFSDPPAMAEAVEEGVIVAGVQIQRFWLQDEVLRFTEKTGVSVVASEYHQSYFGLYQGAMGMIYCENVCKLVTARFCLGQILEYQLHRYNRDIPYSWQVKSCQFDIIILRMSKPW